jgi:hypothetical protein
MKLASKTVMSALVGTSTMTLFSYTVFWLSGKNYKEPELLATFLNRSLQIGAKSAQPLGWTAHYLIGGGWATAYKLLLESAKERPTVKTGLLFGAFGGITGALAWKALFKCSSKPPRKPKHFYTQLFIAHLIFGVTMSLLRKQMDRP